MDAYWLRACLAAVGGALVPDGPDADLDAVCGVSLSARKGGAFKLSVWTKSRADAAGQRAVGAKLRAALELPAEVPLTYAAHDDKAGGSIYEA